MTPLRQRMLEDMQVRNLAPRTQQTYIEQVSRFARHFQQSPAGLGPEEIRAYQVYLTNDRKLAVSSILLAVAALRFLYTVTLKKTWRVDDIIPTPKQPQRLPVVLSPDEVLQFLACAPGPKHRAILTTCYAAGLRISEVLHLRPTDIDSRRMVIRVDQGKGQQDRYVMLSPKLLELLRTWWRVERPPAWLFPGDRPGQAISKTAVEKACHTARRRCGIPKPITPHLLVPGGGLSPDGTRWIACRPGFFLPVRVLSRLFRRLFLTALQEAFDDGQLHFAGSLHALAEPSGFAAHLHPTRHTGWVVYAKRPFAGPHQVLEYVGRYTHRVAIANQRLIDMDDGHVRFRYKNYRAAPSQTPQTMTLEATEFIRRFLLHVLPSGFHRIRYYGWLGHRHRTETLARCRQLLGTTAAAPITGETRPPSDYRDRYESLTGVSLRRCPVCADGHMIVTLSWLRGCACPAARPDTS